MCSQVSPMRSSAPGAKFSTSTSQLFTRRSRISLPLGCLESIVIDRLLWLSMVKYRLSALGTSRSCPRVMSPTPGRSTLMTSAPSQASNCVQVGPDCTWVKSRMRTPSSALPALPHGLVEGLGRPLARTATRLAFPPAASLTTFLPAVFFAAVLFTAVLFMAALAVALFCLLRVAIFVPSVDDEELDAFQRCHCVLPYFLRTALCGLSLQMRPLSVPAAGSITALMRVGLPESMAASTARLSSSGVVAWAPTPPNASAILS